ncbi:hypothetical protein BACCIP111883_04021 [Sutcliffiella rhizosphaerae]|uniref:Uncharacterized protein n=1 Tax=Sutcliffiella rhizosphaerae TaxID=2880967 RepID=A0ABN8ADD9_9BACI|nr:hypothetical protein BACCIP111883_04021 [Sutcliffiella rhizosphaerae]
MKERAFKLLNGHKTRKILYKSFLSFTKYLQLSLLQYNLKYLMISLIAKELMLLLYKELIILQRGVAYSYVDNP